MTKKVYVIYNYYGEYEGFSVPLAILTNKKKAEAYRARNYEVTEIELNDISELKPIRTRTNNRTGNVDIKKIIEFAIDLQASIPPINKKIFGI